MNIKCKHCRKWSFYGSVSIPLILGIASVGLASLDPHWVEDKYRLGLYSALVAYIAMLAVFEITSRMAKSS